MSDVHFTQTADGGEIEYSNGRAVLSDGLESAVYISLFGGNEDDSGEARDDARQWWGNLGETVEARQLRSRTQYLLHTLPATPANLHQIEDAVREDLAWMTAEFATSVDALARITAPRRLSLQIHVIVGESRYDFAFTTDWTSR